MKYFFISLLFVFAFTNDIQAKKNIFILGTYIDSVGDTINCRFKIPTDIKRNGDVEIDLNQIQKRIKVRRISDEKRIILKPKNIKGYEFGYKYNHFVFKSLENELNPFKKKLFLQIVIEGDIKLYKFQRRIVLSSGYSGPYGYSNSGQEVDIRYNKYCVQKGEEQVFTLSNSFYKNVFPGMLQDCSSVSQRYQEADRKTIYKIILEYNECKP